MNSATVRQVGVVAAGEWRRMWRDRSALIAIMVMLLFCATAWVTTAQRGAQLRAEQARLAAIADAQWEAQPDRHPHRVVHFGDFVFKPPSWLSSIDWGVESHAGRSLFLEGHRQNTANFSEAGQGGALLRFGQLTPATVVLQLAPLLLIFVGFGAVAAERANGTLRAAMLSGANGFALVLGKTVALWPVALAVLVPIMLTLPFAGLDGSDAWGRAWWLLLAYAVYLVVWCGLVTIASALAREAYAALLALLCIWVFWCVALPRAAPALAALYHPAPERAVTEIRVENALKTIGDSHNPDDPYFAEFRARTLAKYGVTRVEDLPQNYGGLLMLEGERMTSEAHAREAQRVDTVHAAQNSIVSAFGWIAPPIAAAIASRALSGTDADHHRHFVAAGESRRYALVQALNQLHAEKIAYRDDRAQRLRADHWTRIPRAPYAPPPLAFAWPRTVPALAALLLWLCLVAAALLVCGRRLERHA
jgi:ABC-2 type transport system permease protein